MLQRLMRTRCRRTAYARVRPRRAARLEAGAFAKSEAPRLLVLPVPRSPCPLHTSMDALGLQCPVVARSAPTLTLIEFNGQLANTFAYGFRNGSRHGCRCIL